MTSHDESRVLSEVTTTKPHLTTRTIIKLGTWNGRKMWDIGRFIQVTAEMKRYNLEVLGKCIQTNIKTLFFSIK